MNIIDKAAEAEVVVLAIKIQVLQLLFAAKELAAMAAGLTKQVQKAQTGFAAYSWIIFQALPMAVMQKKFSLNAGKDFENIQVYDVAYCILQLVMQLIYSMIAELVAAVLCGYIIN